MKKGDTVELLVNYGEHYEDVRVRKGYGLANAKEGIGGDANDKPARYQRNFVERDQVEQEIIDLNFIKVRGGTPSRSSSTRDAGNFSSISP